MKKLAFFLLVLCAGFCVPATANAAYSIVDGLSLAPVVPIVLDAFMSVAMAGYNFFVGNGTGIIYIFVWGWLAFTIGMYLVKMYIPQSWLDFFGMKGGQMWTGTTATNIATDVIKPALRGVIAAALLLQVRPVLITEYIVDPFLRFGAIYTDSISKNINQMNMGGPAPKVECPPSLIQAEYLSDQGCNFLIQPVADITHANNQIIKRGLDFISSGLSGMMLLFAHGSRDLLNLITGILLTLAFVASNFFMALLIIQAIFDFGMALIMYPFKVLMFVAKDSGDKWIDPWPAFDGIVNALKKLVITMIACVFILAVNIAAIRALFNFNHSTFVVAAGGSAASNVPVVAKSAMGFGGHSVIWLSAILTFILMYKIFDLTKEQLKKYISSAGESSYGKAPDALYEDFTKDTKNAWKKSKAFAGGVSKATEWGKNTKLGKWVSGKLTGK